MPAIMTQFNGQMMELRLDCFDTAKEVKHKTLNAYFRQTGSPGDQMSLEEFSKYSPALQLDVYSRTFQAPRCFNADDEILDEATEDWFICMARTPQK